MDKKRQTALQKKAVYSIKKTLSDFYYSLEDYLTLTNFSVPDSSLRKVQRNNL